MQTLAAIQGGGRGGGGGVVGSTTIGGAGNANMCRNFKPTSPFVRLPYTTLPFYWDGAAGATNYRLTIYHENGNVVYQRTTNGGETSLPVDAGGLGPGTNFTWQVEALVNGQVACTSALVSIARDVNPNEPTPAPAAPFSASWGCVGLYTIKVSYANLPAGDTSVSISFLYDIPPTPGGGTFSVPPFSQNFSASGPFPFTAGSVTALPSGTTVSLPGSPVC
jgi:hypothetical protein